MTDMIDFDKGKMQGYTIVHCKHSAFRCDCKSVLRRYKLFGDFICVLRKQEQCPRELVNA